MSQTTRQYTWHILHSKCDLTQALKAVWLLLQQPTIAQPKRVFGNAPQQVDEAARRRSEAAAQQLMRNYDGQPSVGIRLMSKMGYGTAGVSPVLPGRQVTVEAVGV